MRLLRIVAVLIASLGLMLQASAYAAAPSAPSALTASHCGGMSEATSEPAEEDRRGCCQDMQMDCLAGSSCLLSLDLSNNSDVGSCASAGDRLYLAFLASSPLVELGGPESPPPQIRNS